MRPNSDADNRAAGIFVFLLGAAVAYWQIVLPILNAMNHVPDISCTTELVGIAPVAMAFGLFMALAGARTQRLFSGPSSIILVIGVLVLVAVIAFGTIYGLETILRSLGYS